MRELPCDRCGACCRAWNCKHLKDDNGKLVCEIYDNRPDKCRSEYAYKIWGYDKKMTWEEFEKFTHYCCELLRKKEEVNV
jgi:Fe-S-cluster containining protein